MLSPSPLFKLPIEILEHIGFQLLEHDPASTTAGITPLLQTCKRINAILSFRNNSHLYSRLFRSRFDHAASARRLGTRTHGAPHLADQLTWYSSALGCIRRGNIYDKHVFTAFSACFALLIENDGKNRTHLEAAGLPDFVDRFVRERLYEDSSSSNGWPQESPINCLALWLLWYTSTEGLPSPLLQHNSPDLPQNVSRLSLLPVAMSSSSSSSPLSSYHSA